MKTLIGYSIAEGIVATGLMTLFVNISGKPVNVPRILGTMLLGTTGPGRKVDRATRTCVVGTLSHYFIGILFAVVFNLLLLQFQIPAILYSIVFGIAAGLVAVCVWKLFITLHPNPPLIPVQFFPSIFMGHIILSFGIFLMMRLITAW